MGWLSLLAATLLGAQTLRGAESSSGLGPGIALAQTLQTNAAGSYKLTPGWTGQCVVAFASGVFSKAEPPVFATNRYALKFDLGVITPKSAVGNVGPKAIAMHDTNGGYRALHTFGESLPRDGEIKAAATQAELERILGPPHGFPEVTGYGAEVRNRLSWRFFSVSSDATLETLQVTAVTNKRAVEALEILRGNAWPEIKAPKKD